MIKTHMYILIILISINFISAMFHFMPREQAMLVNSILFLTLAFLNGDKVLKFFNQDRINIDLYEVYTVASSLLFYVTVVTAINLLILFVE